MVAWCDRFFTNIDQLHFGVWSFQPRYVIIPSYHLYLHCLGFFHANHVISEGISSWFDGPLLRHNMIQLLSYVDHGIPVIFTVWRKKLQTKSGLKQSQGNDFTNQESSFDLRHLSEWLNFGVEKSLKYWPVQLTDAIGNMPPQPLVLLHKCESTIPNSEVNFVRTPIAM